MKKRFSKSAIREAFDNLPVGICYFDQNGVFILCNRQMHRLAFAMTGRGLQLCADLTDGEIKVLRLLCEGPEYKEIAEKLSVSPDAVKYHTSNILSKTGYANKPKLAIAVTNKKLIIPTLPENEM